MAAIIAVIVSLNNLIRSRPVAINIERQLNLLIKMVFVQLMWPVMASVCLGPSVFVIQF